MGTREDILSCARDLYVTGGLRALSLRAVADCAGISAPAIYRHFDGKEDLLVSVALEGHARFAEYLGRALRGTTPRERLIQSGMAYLDFALENRSYYLVMFVAPPEHLGFDRLAKRTGDEGEITFRMLVDRVAECVSVGVLRKDDPVALSMIIWAQVHGLVTLSFRVPDDPEVAKQAVPCVADAASFRNLYSSALESLIRGLGT